MEYYYNNNGEIIGPLDQVEMDRLCLLDNIFVKRSDHNVWLPKSHYGELKNAVRLASSNGNILRVAYVLSILGIIVSGLGGVLMVMGMMGDEKCAVLASFGLIIGPLLFFIAGKILD